MNIINENVKIRTLELNDMDFLQKLWGDLETMIYSAGSLPIKDEDKEMMFEILSQGDDFINHYVIEADGQLVGDMNLRDYENNKHVRLDFKLYKDDRKKGYGKKAFIGFLDAFFNAFEGDSIYVEIWLDEDFTYEKLQDYGFKVTEKTENSKKLTMTKEDYINSVLNV